MVHLRKFILCSFWIPARAVDLDVVMDEYWLRHSKKVLKQGVTQGYAKPVDGDLVNQRDVLQLFFDDSMSDLQFREGNYPGGHVAFVETASIYSASSLETDSAGFRQDGTSLPGATPSPGEVPAWVQRAGNVYLVEANVLGFSEAKNFEVLSKAVNWALRDFGERHEKTPKRIVLHLDVNGTLIMSDVADSFKEAHEEAQEAITTVEIQPGVNFEIVPDPDQGGYRFQSDVPSLFWHRGMHVEGISDGTQEVELASWSRNEGATYHVRFPLTKKLKKLKELTSKAANNLQARVEAGQLVGLPPDATAVLDAALAENISVLRNLYDAEDLEEAVNAAVAAVGPAGLTLTIRTNGVEFGPARNYLMSQLSELAGVQPSHYVVIHKDLQRGLLFHPIMLERLAKNTYTLDQYIDDTNQYIDDTRYCGDVDIHTFKAAHKEQWEAITTQGTELSPGTLVPSMAEELRAFVNAKSERPDDLVFEVQSPEKGADPPINVVKFFYSDLSADVRAAIEELLRKPENLKILSAFNGGLPHKFYPSDVNVGVDTDGKVPVSISLNTSIRDDKTFKNYIKEGPLLTPLLFREKWVFENDGNPLNAHLDYERPWWAGFEEDVRPRQPADVQELGFAFSASARKHHAFSASAHKHELDVPVSEARGNSSPRLDVPPSGRGNTSTLLNRLWRWGRTTEPPPG